MIPRDPATPDLNTETFSEAVSHKLLASAHAMDVPKISQSFTNPPKAAAYLGMPYTSCQAAAILALVATSLSSQHCLFQVPPSPTQADTNHRTLCSSYKVAPGQE